MPADGGREVTVMLTSTLTEVSMSIEAEITYITSEEIVHEDLLPIVAEVQQDQERMDLVVNVQAVQPDMVLEVRALASRQALKDGVIMFMLIVMVMSTAKQTKDGRAETVAAGRTESLPVRAILHEHAHRDHAHQI